MGRLDGKVCLVTASTRGIGYAIAETFALEGGTVWMACRNLEVANEKAAALNAKGCNVKTVYFEAYDDASIKNMITACVQAEGKLDVLVNNFGGTSPQDDIDIQRTSFENYIKYVRVHLASVFIATQEALNQYMGANGGSIINIGSVAGLTPDVSQIAYGTSKAALIQLTKLTAVQAARSNVRCNMICPGMTATEAVVNNLTPEFMNFFLKHTPIPRMATAQEMADAALYFATAEFTTGQIMGIHGGFGIPTPVYGDTMSMTLKR